MATNEGRDFEALDTGITVAACTFIEALGMHWDNQKALQAGKTPEHGYQAFLDLVERNRCHWNAARERWQR